MIQRDLRDKLNLNVPFYIVLSTYNDYIESYHIHKIIKVTKRFYTSDKNELINDEPLTYVKTLEEAEKFIVDEKVKRYKKDYTRLKLLHSNIEYTIKEFDDFFKNHSEEFL